MAVTEASSARQPDAVSALSETAADVGASLYQQLDSRHLENSAAALTEVCLALNPTQASRAGRPVHYRVGHFEHGSLLTHLLHTFTLLPLGAVSRPGRDIVGLEEMPPDFSATALEGWAGRSEVDDILTSTTAELVGPLDSDAEHPLTNAVVANLSVEEQIFAVLVGVASLLGRTKVVDENLLKGGVERFGPAAEESDERAKAAVRDAVRARGWRRTAEQLMSQAELQGIRLSTTYCAPLMSPHEIAGRVELARYTYNSFPLVRTTVDKTVAVTARGMRVKGRSTDAVMRYAEDLIDSSHSERFFAHLIRDAIVCGNGVIDWGMDPTADLRLVRPETIIYADRTSAVVREQGSSDGVQLSSVLHLTGSDQIGSTVGASTLEPFVQLATNRSLFLSSLLQARVMKLAKTTQNRAMQEHARQLESVAVAQLAAVDAAVPAIVGSATTNLPEPPHDLYFPGYERMGPAFSKVRISNQNEKYGQVNP